MRDGSSGDWGSLAANRISGVSVCSTKSEPSIAPRGRPVGPLRPVFQKAYGIRIIRTRPSACGPHPRRPVYVLQSQGQGWATSCGSTKTKVMGGRRLVARAWGNRVGYEPRGVRHRAPARGRAAVIRWRMVGLTWRNGSCSAAGFEP